MIAYQVFGNGGTGGPIDYTKILATVTGTSWQPPKLNPGEDWSFAVRAVDQASGLVDQNIDARCRINVGPDGSDLGLLPATPTITGVVALAGGWGHVEWTWIDGPGKATTAFEVYTTGGVTIDTGLHQAATVPPGVFGVARSTAATVGPADAPAAVVAGGGPGRYGVNFAGLSPTGPTTVSVVAVSGPRRSLAVSAVVQPPPALPLPPESLTITTSDQPAP